jgi:hypothetical protein
MIGKFVRHSQEIEMGDDFFGITTSISLIDVVLRCLNFTGRAAVDIATWTVGMNSLRRLLACPDLDGVRFVIDRSYGPRNETYRREFLERVGMENIRVLRTHAKFVTIRNTRHSLLINTSMNLNKNTRLENFSIHHDPDAIGCCVDLFDKLFASPWVDFSDNAGVSTSMHQVQSSDEEADDDWGDFMKTLSQKMELKYDEE